MVRVQAVECLEVFRVRLTFTDGTQKEIDLDPYLREPIFQPLRNDLRAFLAVEVDPRFGTLTWDNGADIDPDVLYYGWEPVWAASRNRQRE